MDVDARPCSIRTTPRARVAVEHAIQTRTDYDIEYRLINATGERWVSARGRGVYTSDGVVSGMLGVVQDMTEQVRTRKRCVLRPTRYAKVRSVIAPSFNIAPRASGASSSTLPSTILLPVDAQVAAAYRDGRFAECNTVMARMYGLTSPDDLVGKTLDFMLPASDPAARADLASIIEAGYRVADVESKERDADGNTKYFSNSMTGVVSDGRLHRMWGSQRDVSDRKEAERAQAYLAAIVGSADDAIIAKDLNGLIQSVNAAAERVFGYSAAELVGKPVLMLIPPERRGEEDRSPVSDVSRLPIRCCTESIRGRAARSVSRHAPGSPQRARVHGHRVVHRH